jgi:predicted GIY-YIG superfamily endonuclease
VVYRESGLSRSAAGKRELKIKALSREEKKDLIASTFV